jgi:orotidine-5'-phosphate decarboxylase
MAADAVTVSPYLGFGSLAPFLDVAEKNDAGVFVLALTSNPEGPEVQHALVQSGSPAGVPGRGRQASPAGVPGRGRQERTVAGTVLAALREANAGAAPMGPYGAVVGATIGSTDEDLDCGGPLLVPGFGSQGGTVEDLRRIFAGVEDRVLPSTSRGVLSAGPDVAALRDAARAVNDSLRL